MFKFTFLIISALFIFNSSFASNGHNIQCPKGFKLNIENDHRGKPKKICCVREKDDNDCGNGGQGGGCGGNNGGGNNECREVPNCKLEVVPPVTTATASNSNSKCRKTDPRGNIIPGDTCAGTWNIQNGKCCFPNR